MPDRRQHRGPHPQDHALFGPDRVPALRSAVADLSWLLSRGYADTAATALVGDRFALDRRQRIAVRRCACSDEQRARRARSAQPLASIAGMALAVDGFNILTTIEAALAGGVLLRGRDGCVRDMASMHGSWKRVEETQVAVGLVLEALAAPAPDLVVVVLDRPVKNSGRLAAVIGAAAPARGLRCEVRLSNQADRDLLALGAVVATADSGVLDQAERWVDLTAEILPRVPGPRWLLDLSGT